MRYTAIYVDSVRKWAVIDTLSDDFALNFFATERDARLAAGLEETRWSEFLADAPSAAVFFLSLIFLLFRPEYDGRHSEPGFFRLV